MVVSVRLWTTLSLILALGLTQPLRGSVSENASPNPTTLNKLLRIPKSRACRYALVAAMVITPWVKMAMTSTEPQSAIDVSLVVKPEMLRYPGDPSPVFNTENVPFNNDVSLTMSKIELGLHVGTHIDAPGHFIPGAQRIDTLPPSLFIGNAAVVDLRSVTGAITRADLEPLRIPKGSRLFIRTTNSELLGLSEYRKDHVYLSPEAADYLISDLQIPLLAFDYFNIDTSATEVLDSHLAFARAGVPVICGVNLASVSQGTYRFSAVPLRFEHLEASPVRVVLWK